MTLYTIKRIIIFIMKALQTTVSYGFVSRTWTSSTFRTVGMQKTTFHRPSKAWSHNPRFTDPDSTINRSSSSQSKRYNKRSSGINYTLIRSLIWNQLCMFGVAVIVVLSSLYFFDDNIKQIAILHDGIFSWPKQVSPIPHDFLMKSHLLIGVLGSLPPILMGAAIDRSDDYRFAKPNFSTIYMVVTLFGKRAIPQSDTEDKSCTEYSKVATLYPHTSSFDVILWSAIISLITGISEELIFRCIIPAILNSVFLSNIYLVYFVQAILFALGHTSLRVSFQENAVVGGFQFINGLWFGGIFLLSNGDVLPCIVAHAVRKLLVRIRSCNLTNSLLMLYIWDCILTALRLPDICLYLDIGK